MVGQGVNLELQKRFSIFVSIHVSLVVIKFQTLKDLSPKYPRDFFFSCKNRKKKNLNISAVSFFKA